MNTYTQVLTNQAQVLGIFVTCEICHAISDRKANLESPDKRKETQIIRQGDQGIAERLQLVFTS